MHSAQQDGQENAQHEEEREYHDAVASFRKVLRMSGGKALRPDIDRLQNLTDSELREMANAVNPAAFKALLEQTENEVCAWNRAKYDDSDADKYHNQSSYAQCWWCYIGKVRTCVKAPMWDAERNAALSAADHAAQQATEKKCHHWSQRLHESSWNVKCSTPSTQLHSKRYWNRLRRLRRRSVHGIGRSIMMPLQRRTIFNRLIPPVVGSHGQGADQDESTDVGR
jgi:hypothetical protein